MSTAWDSSLPASMKESNCFCSAYNFSLCADIGLDSLYQLFLSASPSDNCVLCSLRLSHISSWKNPKSFNSFCLEKVLFTFTCSAEANSKKSLHLLGCWLVKNKEEMRLVIADHYSQRNGGYECCQIFITLEHFIALEHFIILFMANFPLLYKCNASLLNA